MTLSQDAHAAGPAEAEELDLTTVWNPSYRVFGADTSLWSLDVDFARYRSAGASFVIIKALHGTNIDPYFSRNYGRARREGIPLSTYHWLLPEDVRPIREQVRTYADLLRDYPHDFVPWLDYEGDAQPHDLLRCIDTFHELAGRPIGVYSTFGRLQHAALPARLSTVKLWIAQYSASFPPVPPPFHNWDFWQFTENMPGGDFGFPEDGERLVDMNYFNGTPETFRLFCDPGQAGSPEDRLRQRIEWEVPKPPLAAGDRGIEVLKLQDLLVRAGFMTNAQLSAGPGIFGPRTRAAFMNMQAALALPSSGLYDEPARRAVIARYYTLESEPPIDVTPPPPVPDDAPEEERSMFDGNAVYRRYVASLDRGVVQYHVLKVDLRNAETFVSPQPLGLSMVPTFLEKFEMDIAINGDGWTSTRVLLSRRIEMAGENASRGQVYGRRDNQSSFYIDQLNRVTTRRPATRNIWNALSFPNLLVEDGQVSPRISRNDVDPRTALGFSRDGRYAILVLVDGREAAGSARTGMTFTEVATILVRHGAWIASNQDGGGSSTLAVRDEHDGQVRILNEPCGESPYLCRGRLYNLRPVANHFGIRFLASAPSEDISST